MQSSDEGLRLEVPLLVRFISLLISLAGYIVVFTLVPERALILALIFWSVVQFRAILYAPEITVYQQGIETNRFGFRHFTYWHDIDHFRKGELHSQIYPASINNYVKRFLYSNLLINKWRHNYDEAIKMIEENIEAVQEKSPERVYE